MDREALRRELRAAGLRATTARVAVLGLLRQTGQPLTHADVADALEGEGHDRATLYRNLIDLTDAGLVRRVALGSSYRFEQRDADGESHPHFVCTECGVVRCAPEVKVPTQASRRAPRAVRRGQVDVQLHGVCDDCD